MRNIDPELFRRFEESDETAFIGTLPVAAKIITDNAEMAIESVSVYSDRMSLSFSLRLRDGHPELVWRERGRPGHPHTAIRVIDDLGTDYLVIPGSGGGGLKEWTSQVRIVPAYPEIATTLTLLIAEADWEGRMGYRPDGTPAEAEYRWSVDVVTSGLVLASNATELTTKDSTE